MTKIHRVVKWKVFVCSGVCWLTYKKLYTSVSNFTMNLFVKAILSFVWRRGYVNFQGYNWEITCPHYFGGYFLAINLLFVGIVFMNCRYQILFIGLKLLKNNENIIYFVDVVFYNCRCCILLRRVKRWRNNFTL